MRNKTLPATFPLADIASVFNMDPSESAAANRKYYFDKIGEGIRFVLIEPPTDGRGRGRFISTAVTFFGIKRNQDGWRGCLMVYVGPDNVCKILSTTNVYGGDLERYRNLWELITAGVIPQTELGPTAFALMADQFDPLPPTYMNRYVTMNKHGVIRQFDVALDVEAVNPFGDEYPIIGHGKIEIEQKRKP